jgi:hypothetical protein
MATELAARRVPVETISRQLGHSAPELRTTYRYIKNDPRQLAEAKSAIEEFMNELNRLTNRDLLKPDTSKILPNVKIQPQERAGENRNFPLPIQHL